MIKRLTKLFLLLHIYAFVLGCQSNTEEDKSIASTHPVLEAQLERDSIKTPISDHENPAIYERYRITMEEYESDSIYKVPEMYRGRLAPLDETEAEARKYRTAITKGLKEGINFAGKYTVVTVGCGTGCQTYFVVDRHTGKVLDKIQSSAGARYTRESRLFIVNAPDSTLNYAECRNCEPKAYIFENNRFRQLPKNRQ